MDRSLSSQLLRGVAVALGTVASLTLIVVGVSLLFGVSTVPVILLGALSLGVLLRVRRWYRDLSPGTGHSGAGNELPAPLPGGLTADRLGGMNAWNGTARHQQSKNAMAQKLVLAGLGAILIIIVLDQLNPPEGKRATSKRDQRLFSEHEATASMTERNASEGGHWSLFHENMSNLAAEEKSRRRASSKRASQSPQPPMKWTVAPAMNFTEAIQISISAGPGEYVMTVSGFTPRRLKDGTPTQSARKITYYAHRYLNNNWQETGTAGDIPGYWEPGDRFNVRFSVPRLFIEDSGITNIRICVENGLGCSPSGNLVEHTD